MSYLISVIIPIYNVEKYVERCIHTLLNQTLGNIEFIFVDDCSTDDSLAILYDLISKYNKRENDIRVIAHTENKGSATARNTGLDYASGTYVGFCDADDWLDAEAFEKMYNLAVVQDADIVWTDFFVYEDGNEVICKQNNQVDSISCIKGLLTEKIHGALWNKLYKRTLFSDNDIKFVDSFNMWEDLCVNVKLFYFANNLAYLPSSFYHFVQHKKNTWNSVYQNRIIKEMHQNTIEIITFFEQQETTIFNRELNYLKLASKQILLLSLNKSDFKEWKLIFPESNAYVLSFKRLSYYLRLLGWSISNDLWIIVDVLIFFKKLKKNN